MRRVGGQEEVSCDFRLIAATHRRLSDEVAAGRFREDLYYRIAVFELEVPALRQRQGDLALLIQHFLEQHAAPNERPFVISEEANVLLERHSWPGNVRELQSALHRAVVLALEGEIRPQDLPPGLSGLSSGASIPRVVDTIPSISQMDAERVLESPVAPSSAPPQLAAPPTPRVDEILTLAEIEERTIRAALAREGSNLSRVARELGIGRTTLYRKLEKYELASDEGE